MPRVLPPTEGNNWLGLTDAELPIGAMYEWCVQPNCGAVVLFSGTVRDHAADVDGTIRADVTHLEYEAYDEMVVPKLEEISAECRVRWPESGQDRAGTSRRSSDTRRKFCRRCRFGAASP